MYDDGVNEDDTTAGDNIFTSKYSIGSNSGYHHAIIDCIAMATLQEYAIDNYNSAGWGITYRTE